MLGFFEDDDDGSQMPPGEEVEVGGCTAHHFENYEDVDEYKSWIVTEYRYFHDAYAHSGEWTTSSPSIAVDDQRDVVVVKQKQKAVCEHTGCRETNVQYEEVDRFVFDEEINSTPEQRREHGVENDV